MAQQTPRDDIKKHSSFRMVVSDSTLTLNDVASELLAAHIIPNLDDLHLTELPRNSERRDFLTRSTYRVRFRDSDVCHLTIGPKLEDLWKRSQAFAEACPDIASQPLFFHRSTGLDYLGMEFIEGDTLEKRIIQDYLSPDETLRVLGNVVDALEKSFAASSVEAAAEELEALFESICACPMFGGLDQRFLREFVFPFIRTQAHQYEPRKRWTNGDFIARNIVIDSAGNPRLIDCEFARITHYYGEDAWRWRKIADIPSSHRAFPSSATGRQTDPWLDALFLLIQIKLAHQINGAPATVGSSATAVDDLLRQVSEAHGRFKTSVFYRSLGKSVSPPADESRETTCQLFWSNDGNYIEEDSQRFKFATDTDVTVHFRFPTKGTPIYLRFDPADAPGLVRLTGLRIRAPQTDEAVFILDGQTGWQTVGQSAGVHRLADTPELNLLSLNEDPILVLPAVTIDPDIPELLCDIDIRFTRELGTLPPLLQAYPIRMSTDGEPDLLASLEQAKLELTRTCKREEEAIALLEANRAESISLRERIAELEQELATSRSLSIHITELVDASKAQLQSLATRVAQLEQELSSAETQLKAERDDNAALKRAYGEAVKRLELQRAAFHDLIHTQRAESAALEAEANRRVHQITAAITEAEHIRLHYQDKCNRMQISFSWRITAPLRLLRRWIIDPMKRRGS